MLLTNKLTVGMNNQCIFVKSDDLTKEFANVFGTNGYLLVKDKTLNYRAISTNFAQALGWSSFEQAIGKNCFEVPSEAVLAASQFRELDNLAMDTSTPNLAINICNYASGPIIFLSRKIPIKNNNDKVIGVLINSIDISVILSKQIEQLMLTDAKFSSHDLRKPQQYILSPLQNTLNISTRQQQCLSLLIRGKTIKEIAYILKIAPRTVEDHIKAAKYKLGCHNKSQLIEKAISAGFLEYLPLQFL